MVTQRCFSNVSVGRVGVAFGWKQLLVLCNLPGRRPSPARRKILAGRAIVCAGCELRLIVSGGLRQGKTVLLGAPSYRLPIITEQKTTMPV
jgi:hypothetical protein